MESEKSNRGNIEKKREGKRNKKKKTFESTMRQCGASARPFYDEIQGTGRHPCGVSSLYLVAQQWG
jgi:hypothetical protein